MVFPVVVYRYEGWTIKKAKCQRTDTFKLWQWWRLLRVPWIARRPNQSILKEINPVYSLDLKPCIWLTDLQRADSLEKTEMLGNIEGKRKRGPQRMQWLASITDTTDVNLNKLQEIVGNRGAWYATVQWVAKSRTWLRDWTTTKYSNRYFNTLQTHYSYPLINLEILSKFLLIDFMWVAKKLHENKTIFRK